MNENFFISDGFLERLIYVVTWLFCLVCNKSDRTHLGWTGREATNPYQLKFAWKKYLVLFATCPLCPMCTQIVPQEDLKLLLFHLFLEWEQEPWKCKQFFPNYIIDEVFYLRSCALCRINRGTECLDMTSSHFCEFIWWAGVRSWCSRVCSVDHHFGSFSSNLPTPVRRTITLSTIWPPYTKPFGGIIYTK